MTTLTDFLLARIAEDGAEVAEWPTEGRWGRYDAETMWMDPTGRPIYAPRARVLAECEAKRRIVEALVDAEDAVATYNTDDPNNPPSFWQEWGNLHALRLAVESHAATYADHPDYRDEWKS